MPTLYFVVHTFYCLISSKIYKYVDFCRETTIWQQLQTRDNITVFSAAQFDEPSTPLVIPPPPPPRSSASSPSPFRHRQQVTDNQPMLPHTLSAGHPEDQDDEEDTASSLDPDGHIQSYQILGWDGTQPPDYVPSATSNIQGLHWCGISILKQRKKFGWRRRGIVTDVKLFCMI